MRMMSACRMLALVCLLAIMLATSVRAKSPWQWVSFRPDEHSESSLRLTDKDGPWLIYCTSFAGEGARGEATALAQELQQQLKLKAYVHSQQFDFSETVEGRGVNPDLTPRRMRYDKAGVFDEYAVLLGDFESITDARLKDALKRVKYLQPECIEKNGNRTTRRFAGFREFNKRINGDKEKQRKGPMGSAFATPNPLLPAEFFAPKGVDTFVLKINQGVEHSLLKCQGKYTVRVATFRGNVVIDQRQVAEIEKNDGKMPSSLEQAALKAHRLTEALRKRGVEAYEFHDRHESYVTVGSFDWVGRPQADGRQEMNPAVHATVQRFGPTQQPLVGKNGQALAGLQPRTLDGISFDVQPWPVEVPRHSVAADYVE